MNHLDTSGEAAYFVDSESLEHLQRLFGCWLPEPRKTKPPLKRAVNNPGGASYRETAAALGLSIQTVRCVESHALSVLRKRFPEMRSFLT